MEYITHAEKLATLIIQFPIFKHGMRSILIWLEIMTAHTEKGITK